MRAPKYLDLQLLMQMADYYNIPVPREAEVARKTIDTRQGGVGLDKIVKAHKDKTGTEEMTETYKTQVRPVKLLNDVVDDLTMTGRLVDLTDDPSAVVPHREPVLLEGEIRLTEASEVGALIGRLTPLLLQMAAAGRTDFQPSQAELTSQFFADPSNSTPEVFRVEIPGNGVTAYLVLKGENYVDGATSDEVASELAVFGLVDRIIRDGAVYSLEKYVIPGLNRDLRRLIGQQAINEMLDKASEPLGRQISSDSLNIKGPAIILSVAGIFG